eukprot:CAMPEP_0172594988 /NCGR_PEP_ID=MMETSP1068-20121228/14511_1 /TAXON_ID=35684 /ORGANISM="Pseudopedinella elastica, Strain CCMP716" /LENGTH=33 /DNA_ID= /DNA_START= /DNA_END= /DNA_ORIENTATION=
MTEAGAYVDPSAIKLLRNSTKRSLSAGSPGEGE